MSHLGSRSRRGENTHRLPRLGAIAEADYETALARADVNAVVVATPHADHFEQVRRALRAGKHVLCEKPLAIDPDDAANLSRSPTRADFGWRPDIIIGFCLPFATPSTLFESARSVRSKPRGSSSVIALGRLSRQLARQRPDRGGGTLIDNGTHACDLIRCLLGEIVSAKVASERSHGDPRCEREAYALFRTLDDRVAELRSSWSLERGYLTLEIRGEHGFLHVETAPWRLAGRLASDKTIDRSYLSKRVQLRMIQFTRGYDESLALEIGEFLHFSSTPLRSATARDGKRERDDSSGLRIVAIGTRNRA